MLHRLTRRDFVVSATCGVTMSLFNAGSAEAENPAPLDVVDVPWASGDPHLSDNFLPVARETDAADLPVIAGRVPSDLSGVYMRNGPNPLFKPISFAYPMDGDGMIHAVYIDNGRARYRNRFVATPGLAVEKRAGQAVYGGFTHPVPPNPAFLHPGDSAAPIKNGAFINVIRHGSHFLALNEATNGFEITRDLETLGEWKAGTDQPIRLGAHNRHHPATGDMYAIAYTWREPTLLLHRIDPAGALLNTRTLSLTMPTMVHDFVLTENYAVLAMGPAVFDAQAARAGQSILQWRPELAMRIAVVPLNGGDIIWLETDPFFIFHFSNGFERGNQVVVDYVHHDSLNLTYSSHQPTPFRRMFLDIPRRSVTKTAFAAMDVEFPRINDRFEAVANRYAYMPTLSDTLKVPKPPSATFNTMLKFDTETGAVSRHDFGNRITGEAAFVPRAGAVGEDDGYLAVFAYDPVNKTSDFVLLDAARIDADPVVILRLPQRVPQGLHGNWIPTA